MKELAQDGKESTQDLVSGLTESSQALSSSPDLAALGDFGGIDLGAMMGDFGGIDMIV